MENIFSFKSSYLDVDRDLDWDDDRDREFDLKIFGMRVSFNNTNNV